jgi:hypothetical protein
VKNGKFCEGREYCSPCNTFEYYIRSQSIKFNDEPVLTCFLTLSKKKEKRKVLLNSLANMLFYGLFRVSHSLSLTLSQFHFALSLRRFCSLGQTHTYVRKTKTNSKYQIKEESFVVKREKKWL